MKNYYFKVQKGYHADDYISIDSSELPKAMRAQVTGKIAIFNNGTVSGNHIISITPDYNRIMGWKRDYHLTGEDYEHIGSATVNACRDLLENAKREAEILPSPINPLQLK